MNLIEINALENGAHRNQNTSDTGFGVTAPEGWAVIPDDMEIPATFPFVGVTAEDVNGVMTVTELTPGEMPPKTPRAPTEEEQLRADVDYLLMRMEG